MKNIKEKAREVQSGYDDVQSPAIGSGFVLGANYALDAIEDYMANLNFGSNAAEMFYKDLKANIYKFIEQLKK